MEQYAYRALSYTLFCRVLSEPEFRDWPDVGIVVQAYQPDAEAELRMLRDWVESRGTPITIRLVKGAYWDYEVLTARRLGWPEPVFLQKWQSDAMFERCSRFLIEHHERLRPAFGSHNVRSLAHAIAAAEAAGVPPAGFELQTLHGMGDVDPGRARRPRPPRPRLHALRRDAAGHGLPGPPAAREHVERVVPEGELRRARPGEDLLRNPEEIGAMLSTKRTRRSSPAAAEARSELPPFRNEPLTDFARAENREAMARALEDVRRKLGQTYPLLIAGRGDPHRGPPSRLARPQPELARRGPDRDGRHGARASAPSPRRGRPSRPGRRRPRATGPASC